MLSRYAAYVTIVLAPASAVAQASQPAYSIDWREKHSIQVQRLRGDREVRIAVTDLAPFCFSYVIRINQATALEQPALSVKSILTGDSQLPKGLESVQSESSQSTSAATKPAKGDQVYDISKNALRLWASTDSPKLERADEKLMKVEAKARSAVAAYTDVIKEVTSLGVLRESAKKALAEFVTGACPDGARGAQHESAKVEWMTKRTALLDFVNAGAHAQLAAALDSAEKRGAAADDDLNELLESEDAELQLLLRSPIGRVRTKALIAQLHLLSEAVAGVKAKQAVESANDRKATRGHVELLDKLAKESASWEQPVYLNAESERLEVSILATGRSLPGDLTLAAVTENYSAPVRRKARVVSSVGFALSTIQQRSFGRVTMPRFRGDTLLVKDSVYSTYADRQRSTSLAFAPFVQTHVGVWDNDWWDVFLSGGVGARTVAGETKPEYLGGATVGFGERAFLTLGWHWGRKERLLLGDPSDVARRPVPGTVGDDSAVGTQWAKAFAIVISWKL